MPRNGSGIYFRPPGIDGIPDHSIESAKYNLNVADVETDLNTPRPIATGGTGATNAHDAMIALSGDVARQHVDNYNSFPFVSGSFWSAPSATAGPVDGHAFVGICTVFDGDPSYLAIEARDLTDPVEPGKLYIRRKEAGVWQAWTDSESRLESEKVNRSGDTMTGDLTISKGNPELVLNKTGGGGQATVYAQFNTSTRWSIVLGDPSPETGANAGSDFIVQRWSDAGSYLGDAFAIRRSDGRIFGTAPAFVPIADAELSNKLYVDTQADTRVAKVGDTITGNLGINGTLTVAGGIFATTTPTYYFVDPSHSLGYASGTGRYTLAGGGIDVGGSIYSNAEIVAQTAVQAIGNNYYFQDTGKYLAYVPGTGRCLLAGTGGLDVGGIVHSNSNITADGTITAKGGIVLADAPGGGNSGFMMRDEAAAQKGIIFWERSSDLVYLQGSSGAGLMILPTSGITRFSTGFSGKAGNAGAYDGNSHNFYWTGSATQMWIDSTNFGTVNVTCDYRIKKDVVPLASTWEQVKALKPIVYTQAEFTPPIEKIEFLKNAERAAKENLPPPVPLEPLFVADDVKRWGFLAHELQETLLPSAATGRKDDIDAVQSPNLMAICAALTKALQEAMARIEALEAR